MLKLGKLTDYAAIILGSLETEDKTLFFSSKDIALRMNLPEPTVSKVLKLLSKGGLVTATRGAQGGYQLARPLDDISVADLIGIMEGGLSLTSCVDGHEHCCTLHMGCPMKSGWDELNNEISVLLKGFPVKRLLKEPPAKVIRQAV